MDSARTQEKSVADYEHLRKTIGNRSPVESMSKEALRNELKDNYQRSEMAREHAEEVYFSISKDRNSSDFKSKKNLISAIHAYVNRISGRSSAVYNQYAAILEGDDYSEADAYYNGITLNLQHISSILLDVAV